MAGVSLEVAAIEAATAYAVANGYKRADRRAAGLVLVGMAIAAACSVETQDALLAGYVTALPEATEPVRQWAERLDEAIR